MGHLIVSVILSVFLTLMFESPFIGLEKLLFSGPQKKRAEFKRQQSEKQVRITAANQPIELHADKSNEQKEIEFFYCITSFQFVTMVLIVERFVPGTN